MESQYDLGMIGWLVCTVILGGLATVYGFLKKANKNYWSSSSSCFSLGEIVWTIRSVFKNLTHVVDSCSCCSHGVNRYLSFHFVHCFLFLLLLEGFDGFS